MLRSRRFRWVVVRLFAVVLLVAILALVFNVARYGQRLYADYAAIKLRLDRVEAVVGGNESGQARSLGKDTLLALGAEMSGGQQDFQTLKADIAPLLPVAARLAWLPRVGPTLRALPHFLAMGEHFLAAGTTLLDGLEPLLDAVLGDSKASAQDKGSMTERMLPPLLQAQPRVVEAQDRVELAVAAREQISSADLLPQLAHQLDRLDKYLPALRSASQGVSVAPILLGAVRPMNYVILAQNNDELRPTGGFISAVGVLTLDKGKIARMEFKDGYAVDNWEKDHPLPPEALTRYMDAQLWVFRDANFWPDFPTSAHAVEYFADLDLGLTPDGVIAVDQYALQILVGGLGSVVIPEDNNRVLTAEDTIAQIRAYWKPHTGAWGVKTETMEIWTPERKQYINNVVQAMRTKLESDARSINMAQFAKSLLRVLDEKHALIYLREPLGGGFTGGTSWGGAIPETTGDYFFAVDTNVGFNKVNGIVRKSLDYSVNIDVSGLARARLNITYNNPSTRDIPCDHDDLSYDPTYELMMNRCYWNYLRVYIPSGATLVADQNGGDLEFAGVEGGKDVWATYLIVPPRDKPQLALGYYLPRPVLQKVSDGWEYRLTVQKQSGTDAFPLRVTVTAPAGMQIVSASPSAKSMTSNTVRFETTLLTDREFRVLMR